MTGPHTPDPLVPQLVQALASAVDAIVGGVSASPAATAATGDGWTLTGSVSGSRRGTLEVWIDLGGAESLARRITGADAPDRAAIVTLLRDLWTRAAGALCGQPAFAGLSIGFGTARAAGSPDSGAAYALGTESFTACVVVADRLAPATGLHENLDIVLDIDLPLVVRFARTLLPLRTLATLGPGSVVDMERSPEEPVQILVGGRVIAHGEVVIVGGNYGVKITDVTSPAERVRLEA
jgi:flagellar motor switch protein FliN/FliY